MFNKFGRALAASMVLVLAVPASGQQQFSDSYTFLKAVKERDGDKVSDLVAEPGSVVINTRDRSNGEGALHIVVRGRDLTWLTFLLGKGARPDIQSNRGDTPLTLAAQIGWLDGAEQLLARRAGVDVPNGRGETALILATQRRDVPMVRMLLARRADPNRTDRVAGMSALDYARQDPRAGAVLKLLEAKVAPARPAAGPAK
ncbi:MAG TPA: ankyrin repeat domain-containing protein [Allosphingosinicella sp.]|nr:ankyrin repeat domain-containing protein [Allosphingosinicella sp.]